MFTYPFAVKGPAVSGFNLNLPLDIPWRRIAVSTDMIDPVAGDQSFPLRWQTSIAVFDYQPDDEYQNYEGMLVSYLKVSCSITGFQPRGDEVGLQHSAARVGADRLADGDLLIDRSRWDDSRVIRAYKQAIEDYYGCYGAILEVTVAPKRRRRQYAATQYPFFIDFEPKKRELYEVVTETGETMSRSLSGLNVRKGSTTTESHEVLDIFGGASVQASVAGTGGGVGIQGQWGTKDLNQTEYADMRTTDSAREKRETFSHATQLSQMYHQLNSYHLGTNRALFYMLPRPHIVQLSSDDPKEIDRSTFVDGPRLLEGVQEFFLVVLRPADMEEICVEAYLETAHIFQERIPEYRLAEPLVEEFVVNGSLNERESETKRISNEEEAKSFLARVGDAAGAGVAGWLVGGPIGAALGALFGAAWNEAFGDTLDKTTLTAITRRFGPSSPEVHFDLSRRSQATAFPVGERKQYIGCQLASAAMTDSEVTVVASVYSQKFTENTLFFDTGSREELGKATIRVEVPQRYREPVYVNGEKALFITGRGVSSCAADPRHKLTHRPSVVYEGPLLDPVEHVGVNWKAGAMSRVDANALGAQVRRTLLESSNSPERKPRGAVTFLESDVFASYVGKVVADSPSDQKDLRRLPGLTEQLREQLEALDVPLNRSDLLRVDIGTIAARLDLDLDDALTLRRAALGLVTVAEAAENPPATAQPTATVPDLRALTPGEADETATAAGVRIGERIVVDHSIPRDHVVAQSVEPGTEVVAGTTVDIEISSGSTVRIPDVVGNPLVEALTALQTAGLRCVPEVVNVEVEEKNEGRVLEVEPASRSFVTPHQPVRLLVGTCRRRGSKAEPADARSD